MGYDTTEDTEEHLNKKRITAARRALRAYQQDPKIEQGVTDSALIDLIADLLHLAHSKGLPVGRILQHAENHFQLEIMGRA
jgi:hypothetical protein